MQKFSGFFYAHARDELHRGQTGIKFKETVELL